MNYLAETMISGEWITGFVVAVIGAVGAFLARQKGKAEGRAETITLTDPMPEVPTKQVFSPPTYHQHEALAHRVTRVEVSVDQLRRDQQEQFTKLLQAGETRADRLAEKIDGVAVGFHRRVDQLLNHDPKK